MARKKKPSRKKKSGTAVMTIPKAEAGPPVLQRYHERRKFIAIRLRAKVVDALDRYVAGQQEEDDTITRTAIVERAIAHFLESEGAYDG
jgi:hypothetical protein